MSVQIELKPCLRCGSTKVSGSCIRDGWKVGCDECGLCIHAFHPDATSRSHAKWNTRPLEGALKARVRELEAALDEIIKPIWYMQERARQKGAELDGHMAVYLSNDPTYLQKIARTALQSMDTEK